MPYTAQEKAKILFYLGYSQFEDDGPAMRAVNSLDAKEAVAGTIIRDLLNRLDNVRDQIDTTIPLGKAISDGSIQVRAHYTLSHICKIGRIYVNQLARFTKIAVYGNVFSSGSDASDPGSFYAGDPSENRFPTR